MFAKEFVCPASTHTLICTLLAGLLLGSPAVAQTPTNCEDALNASGGSTLLVHDQTMSQEKRVDEWDTDILKITAPRPGLVEISAVGASSESSLFTGVPSSGTYKLVDGSPVGTNHRASIAVVKGTVYCIEIDPPAGVNTENLRLDVKYTDPCKTGQPDDHGDNFGCATEVDPLNSTTSASITTNDRDVFTFVLTSIQTVELKSTGTTDVRAKLYDVDGVLITSDSDSGVDSNFELVHSLAAGRYYLRVESENSGSGSYSLVAF
ncbi:MAG TPA: T9SS type A sorting domain-containing protein [Thermoanaerobaculia bacterium]|nr:T9SS type A sorting domain-containing protein [Thermoanaerobaculia bacterium]